MNNTANGWDLFISLMIIVGVGAGVILTVAHLAARQEGRRRRKHRLQPHIFQDQDGKIGDWEVSIFASGLTQEQADALFSRVADAAHALDEMVTCSMGPAWFCVDESCGNLALHELGDEQCWGSK